MKLGNGIPNGPGVNHIDRARALSSPVLQPKKRRAPVPFQVGLVISV